MAKCDIQSTMNTYHQEWSYENHDDFMETVSWYKVGGDENTW